MLSFLEHRAQTGRSEINRLFDHKRYTNINPRLAQLFKECFQNLQLALKQREIFEIIFKKQPSPIIGLLTENSVHQRIQRVSKQFNFPMGMSCYGNGIATYYNLLKQYEKLDVLNCSDEEIIQTIKEVVDIHLPQLTSQELLEKPIYLATNQHPDDFFIKQVVRYLKAIKSNPDLNHLEREIIKTVLEIRHAQYESIRKRLQKG